jgi:hypothetical protein
MGQQVKINVSTKQHDGNLRARRKVQAHRLILSTKHFDEVCSITNFLEVFERDDCYDNLLL